uniref:Cohesin subunit SCC3/SA HEAT-repeats domain-containing protein n=1 Tax=Solanum lycopersicum TaxID=4081 RepID=K4BGH7_SOLLC
MNWVEHYDKDPKAAITGLLTMMFEDVFESSMCYITIAMMRNYQHLMHKFMSNKAKIPYLLKLIVYMNLNLYSL